MMVEEIRFKFNPNKDFYTVSEIAEITGKSRQTVYNWIRDGKLKASKPGNWLISRVDFLRFLQRYKIDNAYVREILELERRALL